MQLTLTIKRQPHHDQTQALLKTAERIHGAFNAVAERAIGEPTGSPVKRHRVMYREGRQRFGVSAKKGPRRVPARSATFGRDFSPPWILRVR
jgi:hypothetical protein